MGASRSADAMRNRAAGQARIRRRCTCGRVIAGNVGWHSHTVDRDGNPREGHRYDGRA